MIFCTASSTKVKTTGITSRLRNVEVISPPITTIAIGARKLGSVPRPSAIGSMPAPIAMVVITIGRARLWQASISASRRVMPRSRRAMIAYSTSRIEFFVAMPISMISPIIDGIESAVRVMKQREERAGDRQRQRGQDRHRLHEVLEQQHQHDVDAQHAGQHREAEAREQLAHHLGVADRRLDDAGRQVLQARQRQHLLLDLAQRLLVQLDLEVDVAQRS